MQGAPAQGMKFEPCEKGVYAGEQPSRGIGAQQSLEHAHQILDISGDSGNERLNTHPIYEARFPTIKKGQYIYEKREKWNKIPYS